MDEVEVSLQRMGLATALQSLLVSKVWKALNANWREEQGKARKELELCAPTDSVRIASLQVRIRLYDEVMKTPERLLVTLTKDKGDGTHA